MLEYMILGLCALGITLVLQTRNLPGRARKPDRPRKPSQTGLR